MGEKSQQKNTKQKPARTIKEKRADKRAAAAGNDSIVIVPAKK